MAIVYEPQRLLLGLGVAGMLLAVAGWLIRTTDWSGPGTYGDPFDEDRGNGVGHPINDGRRS